MKRASLIFLSFVFFPLAGCMAIDTERVTDCSGEDWLESTLYLGRTTNGAQIGDEAWQNFIESEVTPRFPRGFTFLDGHGAWKNASLGTTMYEDSTLLIVLHPDTQQDVSSIREIANAYRATFNQDAVLEAHERICVDFISERSN